MNWSDNTFLGAKAPLGVAMVIKLVCPSVVKKFEASSVYLQ